VRALILAIFLLALPGTVRGNDTGASAPTVSPLPAGSGQLVLVRSASWWASTAVLQRYERDPKTTWRPVGTSVNVNLGRAGMGWGRGLHTSLAVGPRKREGDGRSPAGVFRLTQAFGTADSLPPQAAGFPYAKSRSTSYCVEDVRSTYYNQLVDSSRVSASAWEQRSPLLRADGLFDWAVVVQQNAPDIVKSAGSCVFLHIWRGPNRPTSGCTSLPERELEDVIAWLAAAHEPLLVQLPEPVFRAVRDAWGLP
jgi:L,D-peptidoglycan transpeptidase YkuD (ErfK/YbiS/YcfS/YnhG family)